MLIVIPTVRCVWCAERFRNGSHLSLGALETKHRTLTMGYIEGILGIAGAGLSIWLWWLNNRAATKKEIKEQDAAKVHKHTADHINDQLQ
jgi:hypothetical protein